MSQIFGIHCINGLPSTIPLIENLSGSIYQIDTQSRSSVYIASDPAGAQIFIDGIEQTGFSTPAMITDIPSGHHNFRLTSPGHIDIDGSMPLDPGRTYNMFLTMGKSTSTSISASQSDLIVLLALGLIGYFLIKNR